MQQPSKQRVDCTIMGALQFIEKKAVESAQRKDYFPTIGRYYAAIILYSLLATCDTTNAKKYIEVRNKYIQLVLEIISKQEEVQCPPTTLLEEYTKNLASEIAKQTGLPQVSEAPIPSAPQQGEGSSGVSSGSSKSSWDNLPKTLEGKDNPQLLPYPRYEYDAAKKQWKEIPDPSDIVTFDKIAGQEAAKRKIQEALVRPFLFPNLYTNKTKQKAFMWYGVPGTGKTTLAEASVSAIRNKAGEPIYRTPEEVNALDKNPYIGDKKGVIGFRKTFYPDPSKVPKVILFNAGISDLESKFKGEGERKMARFFQMAIQVAPTIIFFDEADAYLDPSKELNSGIITTFKQEQGGFGAKTRDIVTILATNYPTRIEGAILSRVAGGDIEIGIPDQKARAKIVVNSIKDALKVPVFNQGELNGFSDKIGILTAPPNWKTANPEQFSATNFPGILGAEAIRKSQAAENVYSGRDVFNMSKEMAQNALDRVANGRVRKCTKGETDAICAKYRNWYKEQNFDPENLWVYISEGVVLPPTSVVTETQNLSEQERNNVVQTNIILEDVLKAFIEFKPTVTMADIFEQMKFNESRGDVDTTPASLSSWWQNKLAKSPPPGKYITTGTNHTVPPN